MNYVVKLDYFLTMNEYQFKFDFVFIYINQYMLTLEEIKEKYGRMCSFAIWSPIDESKKSKFGVGDITHFDNLDSLIINRNIILAGLNLSGKGTIDKPFSNFHNPKSTSQDYRIRLAMFPCKVPL